LTESIVVPGTRPGSVSEAWRLAAPTIIGMLSVTLMWMIDTILLGRVGKVELAAAGFGGTVVWTAHTFFIGGVTAVGTFVAQAAGAGRRRECAVFAWQGLYLSLAGALLLVPLLIEFDALLRLAGPAPDVFDECLRYSRVRMLGGFFLLGTFALAAFFRGIGEVKTPMLVAIIANALNVLLDILLIFGVGPFPRWTTFGAGLATTIATGVGFLMLFTVFLGPRIHAVYRTRHDHPLRLDALRRLLRVGLPMGVQFFLDMGSFTVFAAIMGRLGTDALAATQIAIQLLAFSFMPATGVARAATTLVGQYLGAGQRALAERCGWVTLKMNIVYSLGIAAVFLVAREHLFAIFNDDPGVIAAGTAIVPLLALFQILDAAQMAYQGALQGAGDTTFTMIAYATTAWALFLPLALLLAYPARLGVPGGWLGGVLYLVVLNAVLTWRYRGGSWKRRRI
jgi:MATE family multidrug resistance protein